jgi:hypothetical protein
MNWKPIESAPINEKILLYWLKSQHIEDGRILMNEGNRYHILFDGESLNDEPNLWMYIPKV